MRNMTSKQYCQTANFALFNTFFSFLNSFFYFIHLLFVSLRTLLGRLWIAKKTKLFSLPSVWEWAIPAYHVHAVGPVLKC